MNYELINKLDEYIKMKRYRLINSVLLYQDDELKAERFYNDFTEESRNNLKSVWKSILSLCVGICLDKGMIKSLEEPVADFLPEFDGRFHPYHKLLKIIHLLTMSSGIYWNGGIHYHCPMMTQCFSSGDMIGYIADVAMADIPGTKFHYKEWDVILLSEVVAKASGMNTYDFCNEYLYRPMDIKSGRWYTYPNGLCYTIPIGVVNSGEEQAKSDLSAHDLAKIGFLVLDKGKYKDKQIVSEGYLKKVTTPSDCNESYGLLWWLGKDSYGCRGFGGQEVTVIPEKKIVYVIQAKATSSGKAYSDVLEYLLKELTEQYHNINVQLQ